VIPRTYPRKMRTFINLFLALILLWSAVSAIRIQVSGSWNLVLTGADLEGPPGSNLRPEHESLSDAVRIRVKERRDWEVDVRKSDINWHPDLHLFIRRTSDGKGRRGSVIIGGWNYQEISDFDQRWFWGRGDRDNINTQLKISGVSVSLPAGMYTTIITYTAIEL